MDKYIKTETLGSLQLLRALAAILVLLRHGTSTIRSEFGYHYLSNFFKFGYCGVDIFFVLSGFVIYYSTVNSKRKITVYEFLSRRFVRIFPIYWIALISYLILYLLSKYCLNSAVSIPTVNVFLENFFLILTDSSSRMLVVSWTLSYEVLFYMVFGILFLRKPALFFIIFIFWVSFCYINIFFLRYDVLESNPIRIFLSPIVVEFLFGCIAATLILKYSKYSLKYKNLCLVLGILLMLLFVINEDSWRDSHREITIGISSALIVYAAAHIRRKIPAFFIFMGDASYSIYLFHILLLHIIIKVLMILKLNNYFHNFFGSTFIFLFTIFLCCSIYYYIEKPLLAFCKKQINLIIHTRITALKLEPNANLPGGRV